VQTTVAQSELTAETVDAPAFRLDILKVLNARPNEAC
jgi:hypothetical protein